MQKYDFNKVEATFFSEYSPVKCLNLRKASFLKNWVIASVCMYKKRIQHMPDRSHLVKVKINKLEQDVKRNQN